MHFPSTILLAIWIVTSAAALSLPNNSQTLTTPSLHNLTTHTGPANLTEAFKCWPPRPFEREITDQAILEVRSLQPWELAPSHTRLIINTISKMLATELTAEMVVEPFDHWSTYKDGVALGFFCVDGNRLSAVLARDLFLEALSMMRLCGVVSMGAAIWERGREVGYLDVYVDVI